MHFPYPNIPHVTPRDFDLMATDIIPVMARVYLGSAIMIPDDHHRYVFSHIFSQSMMTGAWNAFKTSEICKIVSKHRKSMRLQNFRARKRVPKICLTLHQRELLRSPKESHYGISELGVQLCYWATYCYDPIEDLPSTKPCGILQ